MAASTYLIAIGSNVAGARAIVARAARLLEAEAVSRIITSRPLGPSFRDFANAAVIVRSRRSPPGLLTDLKAIERAFGRRDGRRWGARPLDLDILGWSGGVWSSRNLTIPHPAFRTRRFVLAPLVEIAPGWRDPVTGLTARQLLARLDRRRPRP